ncbi:MAG: formate dehydrogenase accessory sulfurtransferase FdhD [Acidobacteriota bacterium]|nr:formate dehydrogenase accessory sulfurtransferase FdhD [Acidobacteriota bacterium]
MSVRMISTTGVHEWVDGQVRPVDDFLVREEPLEIRIGMRPISVTMRTPGHDRELAAGFLFTEGILSCGAQIAAIEEVAKGNRVTVTLSEGETVDEESTQRNFYTTSSCGVCGKATLNAVHVRGIKRVAEGQRLASPLLFDFADRLRQGQAVFERTGALHGAALFRANGELLVLREDVGRHNAVDKVIGWALLNNLTPLSDCVLMVSGRGGFEIVQKAVVAGIPILASVSAPSDLAVKLAREFGMTLAGFVRGQRFVIYSGAERLQ